MFENNLNSIINDPLAPLNNWAGIVVHILYDKSEKRRFRL